MDVKQSALVIAAGLAAVVALHNTGDRSRLAAFSDDPFLDTDADTVPDRLEWVTLSSPAQRDSDGDGRDDFLEVVQHTATYQTTPSQPLDNEMRVLVSTVGRGPRAEVWMDCLFRFVGAGWDVSSFDLFVNNGQAVVPISRLIGQTPMDVAVRPAGNEGTFVRVSLRLASEAELKLLLPCTISAVAVLGGRRINSGMFVFDSGSELCALVPRGLEFGRRAFFVQSLWAGDEERDSRFFRSNKVCEWTLSPVAATPAGTLCEVNQAECEPANGLRCGTRCTSAVGAEIFIPSGLAATTGG